MSRLRLLAIIEADSITGPAKNLFRFATAAKAAGVETVMVTFVRTAPTNVFLERARELGIPVETIAERRAFDWGVVRELREVAKQLRPDVIQTHAVKSHFLARMAGLPELAPWIGFHHGYTWPTLKARLYNQLDRWSLPAASRVLTVSTAFREELAQKGVPRDHIEVIHNAISPDWGTVAREEANARALRERWNIPGGRAVVLIAGRLSREKDHVSLLRAVKELSACRPLHLLIVGEGPERGRIEAAIREMALEEMVTLTGQQPSAEPYYGIADLVVLASRSEGSPNALLEAMAAGIPAVATRVGGIPEIVEDNESALLVAPDDAKALAQAMRRILVDEPGLGERLAARARVLVLERHSPEQRLDRLVRIYFDASNLDGKAGGKGGGS